MIIGAELYYELELKNKDAEGILREIRRLRSDIARLKNKVEYPDYVKTMYPDESTFIQCSRIYLERAKQALADVGGTYVMTREEEKAASFDADIPDICEIVFSIGGFFEGRQESTATIQGEIVRLKVEEMSFTEPKAAFEEFEYAKEDFLGEIGELYIGEWDSHYDSSRFGVTVLDGTQWSLEIYYSNGAKVVKSGNNLYPYNFDKLLELMCVDRD